MPRRYNHNNELDRRILLRAQHLAAQHSISMNYSAGWSDKADAEITNWRPNFDSFTPDRILLYADQAEQQIMDEADPEYTLYLRLKNKFGGR